VPAELTVALLTTVPAAFHAGVQDILLAGLATAVARWRQRRGQDLGPVLVDVEGHGRVLASGPGGNDVDLSRTVGWFTAIYPVRLDPATASPAEVAAGGAVAEQVVKRVKEQLRAVPGDGLGYGLLRYLNPETAPVLAALPAPQIGFNYLGRFLAGPRAAPAAGLGGPGDWALSGMPARARDSDETSDAGMPAVHVLEVSAVVVELSRGPELRVTLSWLGDPLEEQAVRELGADWLAALGGIAACVARSGAGGHTPSDFPLITASQEDIDKLEKEMR